MRRVLDKSGLSEFPSLFHGALFPRYVFAKLHADASLEQGNG